ncbi:glutathione synthase/RimK-type ligase-like ATP-grasp enzyme [Paenibacillus sp. V4I3]|uniref:YheC/YheD family protein n=1 Tax=Paenibacillus sp. V4I3 TaxID=3042305 RepID=UPI00277F4503|nr:YheC/YheD family protein [Paenibacillus sp. V4I3]MDQ0877319.1 glutathione synthase/RimK-type ligase-like ATP-grasp enzyme [Paenibacillus sp. V4I3]
MRMVANKWSKFSVLLGHAGVAKHIPDMRRFSASNLQAMLRQYVFVVAKPIIGTGGSSVVKIQKTGNGYLLHDSGTKRTFRTWNELFSTLNRIRKNRLFMLQQGIDLATIEGRPVDYRVKLKKAGRSWVIRAVVGRLARPGLFVTNLCRGGTLLKGAHALRQTFPASLVKSKIDTMCGVARTCTMLLESRYPGIGMLGYDFGIDKRGNVWIFEVNTKPH